MSMEASDPSNSDGLVLGKHFVAVSSSLEKFLKDKEKALKGEGSQQQEAASALGSYGS